MRKIVQRDAKVLRDIAKEVPVKDIPSFRIQKIIEEMKVALASQDDGVAIAAPQIGYPLRIFVVSGKVENLMKGIEDVNFLKPEDTVFINPIIKKISKEKKLTDEGCLSVRYLYGRVKRATKATVVAYDENGKKKTIGGSGILAQIFQHEIDHFNGILFIDKAVDLEEILPQK